MTGSWTTAREALSQGEYGEAPSVLLFADTDAAMDRCRRTAEATGCRVGAAASIEDGPARLSVQVAADAALVEAEADPGEPLDRLLSSLRSAAHARRFDSLVVLPRGLRPRGAPDRRAVGVYCLSGATGFDRLVTLRTALMRRRLRFSDVKGQGGPKLQQLSEEMGRIATMLAAISEQEMATKRDEDGRIEITVPLVRAIIRARRTRDEFFVPGLFADPAWDMLLDLFAARLQGEPVSVSSLCIAAAVPQTTALRWIKVLTDHGLATRADDPQDGRRVFVQLTDTAAEAMQAALTASLRIAPAII
jgi:DNA-binding transcriptional ArsR family regulator